MRDRDELVEGVVETRDGTVDAVVLAEVRLDDGGDSGGWAFRRENLPFTVRTRDGRRILVEAAPDALIEPERDARGPWRELRHHPAAPSTDGLNANREVRLRGRWVSAGDQVTVIGSVNARAPMRARGVGVGATGRADLERELGRRRSKATAAAAPGHRRWALLAAAVIAISAAVTAALVVR